MSEAVTKFAAAAIACGLMAAMVFAVFFPMVLALGYHSAWWMLLEAPAAAIVYGCRKLLK